MNKLIIDVASEKIFLMIISNANIYNITHENTKINYEKLTIIINRFSLSQKILKLLILMQFILIKDQEALLV